MYPFAILFPGEIGRKPTYKAFSYWHMSYYLQLPGLLPRHRIYGHITPTDGINVNELRRRRDSLSDILKQIEGISFFTPNSTFYLFPDVTDLYHHMEAQSYEDFRSKILRATGVSFCTREHFGTHLANKERKYIRFAYSGITVNDIEEGMARLNEYSRSFDSLLAV